MDVSITIKDLGVPEPVKKKCPVEVVRDLVREVDAGVASMAHWKLLCLIFDKLHEAKKLNPKQELMLKTILPVMEKYNYHKLQPQDLEAVRDGEE